MTMIFMNFCDSQSQNQKCQGTTRTTTTKIQPRHKIDAVSLGVRLCVLGSWSAYNRADSPVCWSALFDPDPGTRAPSGRYLVARTFHAPPYHGLSL